MMQILFVSRTWPFPARNGVELPVSELAHRLSARHQVDIAVWGESDPARMRNAEKGISGDVFHVPSKTPAPTLRIFREIAGLDASFMAGGFGLDILHDCFKDKLYDWAWVSPIGGLGLLRDCRRIRLRLVKHVAVGQNDALAWNAWNGLIHMLEGKSRFSARKTVRGLRAFSTAFYERRYCAMADLICMQTQLEKDRMQSLLGRYAREGQVVVLPNGCKEFLKTVNYGHDCGFHLLYMTHLDGPRAQESHWFLKRVWPIVVSMEPEARLHLVGSPPSESKASTLNLGKNIEIRGFVPDLQSLYANMTLSVVPTPHASGLVNRVQDALVAGLPVVARRGPLSTIDGLVAGRDAIMADRPAEFAWQVVDLLRNPERRKALSQAGRKFASRLPSWQESAEKVEALFCEVRK